MQTLLLFVSGHSPRSTGFYCDDSNVHSIFTPNIVFGSSAVSCWCNIEYTQQPLFKLTSVSIIVTFDLDCFASFGRMKWPYEMAVWAGVPATATKICSKSVKWLIDWINTQKWDRIRRRQSAPAVRLVYYMCFVFLVWLAVTKASHVVYEFWNIANHVAKRRFFCEQERASENKRKRERKGERERERERKNVSFFLPRSENVN